MRAKPHNVVLSHRRWRAQRHFGIIITLVWLLVSAIWGGYAGFLMFDTKQ